MLKSVSDSNELELAMLRAVVATLRKWMQEDQIFKVIHSYTARFWPVCVR